MNIEEYRDYCLTKKGVEETTPFGPNALVYKVMGKVFTIADLEIFASFNVKCDPERAVLLREEFEGVLPGYHMNKKHWNTILMDGSISDKNAKEWLDHSYELVVKSLTKKLREKLSLL